MLTLKLLTFEQCRNLAEWGLPQELKPGDKYWGYSEILEEWLDCFIRHECVPLECKQYYKIPDLETLMQFARGLDRQWTLASDPKTNSWWVEWDPSGPIWGRLEAQGCKHPWHGFEADKPEDAVVALIRKLTTGTCP